VPSNLHELLVELFRSRPRLVPELLAGLLDVPVPEFESVRSESGDAVDLVPTEYRADSVVVLTHDARPVLAVVVEVQLSRDIDKIWSWPVYVSTLRARLRCPVELLVVCPDRGVAGWCATPIRLGLGEASVRPLVLDRDLVPVVAEPHRSGGSVELAVLSALAHADGPHGLDVLDTLWGLLQEIEPRRALDYLGLVYAALPSASRRHLEDLMTTDTDFRDNELAQWLIGQGEAKGKAEGKAEGEARAVLTVLAARGVEVPEPVRRRIAGCRDLAQLDLWVRRAVTADTVDDLDG
jgi:hypothetical protein